MTSGRILYWMPNTDLRQRHTALAEIAKKEFKIDVNNLKLGEMIMFINSSWTQFILYCAGHVLLHHRRPDGGRLKRKALMLVPVFMKGQQIDYSRALRSAIESEYRARYPRYYIREDEDSNVRDD